MHRVLFAYSFLTEATSRTQNLFNISMTSVKKEMRKKERQKIRKVPPIT